MSNAQYSSVIPLQYRSRIYSLEKSPRYSCVVFSSFLILSHEQLDSIMVVPRRPQNLNDDTTVSHWLIFNDFTSPSIASLMRLSARGTIGRDVIVTSCRPTQPIKLSAPNVSRTQCSAARSRCASAVGAIL